jgi:hypothetical protein
MGGISANSGRVVFFGAQYGSFPCEGGPGPVREGVVRFSVWHTVGS